MYKRQLPEGAVFRPRAAADTAICAGRRELGAWGLESGEPIWRRSALRQLGVPYLDGCLLYTSAARAGEQERAMSRAEAIEEVVSGTEPKLRAPRRRSASSMALISEEEWATSGSCLLYTSRCV